MPEILTFYKARIVQFVWRHQLRSVTLSGEGDSARARQAARNVAELHEKLGDFPTNNILNVGEARFIFNLQSKNCTFLTLRVVNLTKEQKG